MKKLMIAELAVLTLILVGMVIACFGITSDAFAEDPLLEVPPESTSEPTEEMPVESTTEFVPDWPTYPASRTLLAKQYFVYDCNSESFLTSSGTQNERVYPASITKLFTAYVALQYLQPGAQITAGNELDLVAWGSSVAKIERAMC